MHRTLKRLAAAAVAVCISLSAVQCASASGGGDIMVRVGLASAYYHNNTGELEAAHLQNEDSYGSGYRFGYYDRDLDFVELGYTDEDTTKIAVLKTANLGYGYSSTLGKNTYSASIDSGISVGSYYILVEDGLNDFDEAQEAASEYDGGFVAWIDGEYQVRAGSFKSEEDAQRYGERGKVVKTSSYGLNVVETGTDRILFQFDEGTGSKLAIQPGVEREDETRTWFNGFLYRGGFQYQRRSGGNVSVINVLPLEDYVNGVICYEMGRSWPLEALKAQALCARTYVLKNMGSHESYGFDICNSTYCQVYRGMGNGSESYSPSKTSMQAVEETKGLVVTYRGKLAETMYSSSFGGASEDAKNVWGTDTVNEHPYLQGVVDPYESDLDSSNAKSEWTVSYTASELTRRLQSYGYGTNTDLDYLELTYSTLGNVIAVAVHWENGQTNTLYPSGKKAIRSVFGVDSIRFTVNGETANSASKPRSRKPSSEGAYAVNGDTVEDLYGMYTILGEGEVSKLDEKSPYVISGSGSVSSLEKTEGQSGGNNQGGGTVVVSGRNYVFEGGGFGHQLGMSQYGANAMARRGMDYEDIITFYFPGVKIQRY